MTFSKVHDGRSYGYSYSGPKWRCDTCGRTGYSDGDPSDRSSNWKHWSDACKHGHAPCEWCGRQLTLRQDGTPRVHTRCPDRPDDAELLRLIATEVHHDARLGVRGPLDRHSRALLARLTQTQEPV